MKLVTNDTTTVTIQLTEPELYMIFNVLAEVRSGPNAFDDQAWTMLINAPRGLERSTIDALGQILQDRKQPQP